MLPSYYTGKINNTTIIFGRFRTPNDGSCGFHALNIVKEEAVKKLREGWEDPNIRKLVAREILGAFKEKRLYLSNTERNHETQILRDRNLQDQCQYLKDLIDSLERHSPVQLNSYLSLEEVQRADNNLSKLLAMLKDKAKITSIPDETIRNVQSHLTVNKNIEDFCEGKDVYLSYVNYYIAKTYYLHVKNGVLDALARLYKLRVFVYGETASDNMELRYDTGLHENTENIRCIFHVESGGVSNMHFDRLEAADSENERLLKMAGLTTAPTSETKLTLPTSSASSSTSTRDQALPATLREVSPLSMSSASLTTTTPSPAFIPPIPKPRMVLPSTTVASLTPTTTTPTPALTSTSTSTSTSSSSTSETKIKPSVPVFSFLSSAPKDNNRKRAASEQSDFLTEQVSNKPKIDYSLPRYDFSSPTDISASLLHFTTLSPLAKVAARADLTTIKTLIESKANVNEGHGIALFKILHIFLIQLCTDKPKTLIDGHDNDVAFSLERFRGIEDVAVKLYLEIPQPVPSEEVITQILFLLSRNYDFAKNYYSGDSIIAGSNKNLTFVQTMKAVANSTIPDTRLGLHQQIQKVMHFFHIVQQGIPETKNFFLELKQSSNFSFSAHFPSQPIWAVTKLPSYLSSAVTDFTSVWSSEFVLDPFYSESKSVYPHSFLMNTSGLTTTIPVAEPSLPVAKDENDITKYRGILPPLSQLMVDIDELDRVDEIKVPSVQAKIIKFFSDKGNPAHLTLRGDLGLQTFVSYIMSKEISTTQGRYIELLKLLLHKFSIQEEEKAHFLLVTLYPSFDYSLPLCLAAYRFHLPLIQLLIESQANVNWVKGMALFKALDSLFSKMNVNQKFMSESIQGLLFLLGKNFKFDDNYYAGGYSVGPNPRNLTFKQTMLGIAQHTKSNPAKVDSVREFFTLVRSALPQTKEFFISLQEEFPYLLPPISGSSAEILELLYDINLLARINELEANALIDKITKCFISNPALFHFGVRNRVGIFSIISYIVSKEILSSHHRYMELLKSILRYCPPDAKEKYCPAYVELLPLAVAAASMHFPLVWLLIPHYANVNTGRGIALFKALEALLNHLCNPSKNFPPRQEVIEVLSLLSRDYRFEDNYYSNGSFLCAGMPNLGFNRIMGYLLQRTQRPRDDKFYLSPTVSNSFFKVLEDGIPQKKVFLNTLIMSIRSTEEIAASTSMLSTTAATFKNLSAHSSSEVIGSRPVSVENSCLDSKAAVSTSLSSTTSNVSTLSSLRTTPASSVIEIESVSEEELTAAAKPAVLS